MEQQSVPNNRSQSPLYQDVRVSFTPSFFSHGWECMLTPISQHSDTYLDTPGSIRISWNNVKSMLLKVKEAGSHSWIGRNHPTWLHWMIQRIYPIGEGLGSLITLARLFL